MKITSQNFGMLVRIVFFGALSQMFVACGTTTTHSGVSAQGNGAEVLIYKAGHRDGDMCTGVAQFKVWVTLNGEQISVSSRSQHKAILSPGTYVITKVAGGDAYGSRKDLQRESLTFEVNPNEIIKIGVGFYCPFVFNRYELNGVLIDNNPTPGLTKQCESFWAQRDTALYRRDQASADMYVNLYNSCLNGTLTPNSYITEGSKIPTSVDPFVGQQPSSNVPPLGSGSTSATSNLDLAKTKCSELGLKPGTEKFGECVLRLSK